MSGTVLPAETTPLQAAQFCVSSLTSLRGQAQTSCYVPLINMIEMALAAAQAAVTNLTPAGASTT